MVKFRRKVVSKQYHRCVMSHCSNAKLRGIKQRHYSTAFYCQREPASMKVLLQKLYISGLYLESASFSAMSDCSLSSGKGAPLKYLRLFAIAEITEQRNGGYTWKKCLRHMSLSSLHSSAGNRRVLRRRDLTGTRLIVRKIYAAYKKRRST